MGEVRRKVIWKTADCAIGLVVVRRLIMHAKGLEYLLMMTLLNVFFV